MHYSPLLSCPACLHRTASQCQHPALSRNRSAADPRCSVTCWQHTSSSYRAHESAATSTQQQLDLLVFTDLPSPGRIVVPGLFITGWLAILRTHNPKLYLQVTSVLAGFVSEPASANSAYSSVARGRSAGLAHKHISVLRVWSTSLRTEPHCKRAERMCK